jgi:DMSO/TMAO reductase YedYZ molybdopterin-dependent catalytic subunit
VNGFLRSTMALVAVIGLNAGCVARANSEPIPAEDTAGAVLISGDVANPAALSAEELRALPSQTQSVTFDSKQGQQHHTYVGPRLIDVIESAGPTGDSADEHAHLATAVVATGADGYTAAVAWGEISPVFAASPVLVAHTEDGEDLERPRLVVPGDIKGGRYVSDVTELRVVNLH